MPFLSGPYRWLLCCLLVVAPCSFAEQADDQSPNAPIPAAEQVIKAKSDAPRVLRDPAKLSLLGLAEALPKEQVLWLQGREFDPDAVMALYLPASLPANNGRPRGGMLLLHDEGQHPDWPKVVGELRKAMPEKGWHTLSLALLYADRNSVPERTMLARTAAEFPHANASLRNPVVAADSENSEENADLEGDAASGELAGEEAPVTELTSEFDIDAGSDPDSLPVAEVDTYPTDMATTNASAINNSQRIELGLQQLNSLGIQVNCAVGVGKGAEQILSWLLATSDAANKIQGMVWINAKFSQQLLTEVQEKVPNWRAIKVLDIYDSTQPALKIAASQRRQFALRFHPANYQSSSLSGLTLLPVNTSQRLVNRIWSWQKSALARVKN